MTGRAAGGGTQAAQFSRWGLGRRSIPAKQPVMKPARRSAGDPSRLTASLRAAHRCVSVGIHPVFLPHAPRQPGASPASALTRVPPPAVHRVASRRSSLRFGRNTLGPVLPVGAPPPRALSAGRLPGLGAHVGSTTGCSPRRFAPLIVAFRSKYTRYSSLTRLVSRASHRPRRSPGFHRRPLATRHVAGCRWRTGLEVAIIRRPACGAEVFHR